eukprot:363552-Chlamydomonas_euryale.AAC.7
MGDPTGRDDVLAAQGLATQGAAAMPGAAVGAMRFDGGRAPSNALPAGTQAMQQYVQLLGGLAEGKETGGGSAGGGGMDPQLANLQQQLSMLHFLQAAPQQQQQQQMQMQHLQQQLLQQQLWLRQSQAQQQKQLQQLQQLAYSMSQGSGTDAGWSHQHGSPDPTASSSQSCSSSSSRGGTAAARHTTSDSGLAGSSQLHQRSTTCAVLCCDGGHRLCSGPAAGAGSDLRRQAANLLARCGAPCMPGRIAHADKGARSRCRSKYCAWVRGQWAVCASSLG